MVGREVCQEKHEAHTRTHPNGFTAVKCELSGERFLLAWLFKRTKSGSQQLRAILNIDASNTSVAELPGSVCVASAGLLSNLKLSYIHSDLE